MTPLFCLLFLFVGQSLASPSSNQYFDTIIHTTLPNVIRTERLDPTHLQDYTFEYTDKILFKKVHGKAEYSNGTLTGLSKVQRYSECQGPYNTSSGTVITCTLTFPILETSYKGKVKYGVLPQVGIKGKGTIQYIVIEVEVTKPFNQVLHVTRLQFRNVGSMKTDFSGLGPLNGQMKVLENNYRQRVSSDVLNVITNRFRFTFETAAASVPMPLR